jgi:hypothetical protein
LMNFSIEHWMDCSVGDFLVALGRLRPCQTSRDPGFLFWLVWHEVNSSFHKQINMGERRSVGEYGRKE